MTYYNVYIIGAYCSLTTHSLSEVQVKLVLLNVLDHDIDITFNNQCLHNINKIQPLHGIETECRSQSLKENIQFECMSMQVLQAMNTSGIKGYFKKKFNS